MTREAKEMVLAVMPEGPIAHDGQHYRYSKGERLYLDNLAKGFKQLILITFVFREGDEAYESCLHSKFMADNISVIELPRPIGRQLGVLGKVWQLIKVFWLLLQSVPKVDLMYLFLPSYPSALGWVAAKFSRKPHVVYGADDWEQASASMFKWESLRGGLFYKTYSALNRWMERKIVQGAIFSVAAGGQLREKYKAFSCPTYDTTPRITLTSADIFERENTCAGKTITLINVGNLIHDKAQHILIRAFAKAAESDERLRLKIVGQGPRELDLKQLSIDLGVEKKIDFVGYVEEEKTLYGLLRSADIFVLSSVTEGFPRALYEAMSMRLPIVTTDVGGIPFLLHNDENAKVVPSGDIEQMSLAINDLAVNSNLRKTIIQNAAKTVDAVFQRMNSSQIADLVNSHMFHS